MKTDLCLLKGVAVLGLKGAKGPVTDDTNFHHNSHKVVTDYCSV